MIANDVAGLSALLVAEISRELVELAEEILEGRLKLWHSRSFYPRQPIFHLQYAAIQFQKISTFIPN